MGKRDVVVISSEEGERERERGERERGERGGERVSDQFAHRKGGNENTVIL